MRIGVKHFAYRRKVDRTALNPCCHGTFTTFECCLYPGRRHLNERKKASERLKATILIMQSNQNELGNHLKAKDVPNLTVLGKAIKKLKWRKSKVNGTRGYYLRLKKQ